jgi:hypothetical protein
MDSRIVERSRKTDQFPSELTTNFLTDEVIMHPTAGNTGVADRFFPENMTTNSFIEIPLEGAECPLAGNVANVKGSVCGESVHTNASSAFVANKTGELFEDQTLLFSEAIQKTFTTTTKPCALTIGSAAGSLDGAVDNTLAGTVTPAFLHKPFGAD